MQSKKYEIEVNLVHVIFRFNERSDGFWQSVRRAREKEDTFREQLQPSTRRSPEWASVCFERAIEFFKLQRDFPWRSFHAGGGDDSLENDVALVINAASSHSDRIYAKQPIDTHSTHVANERSAIPFGNFSHAFLPLDKVL